MSFQDERTEEPGERELAAARERGLFAFSRDLVEVAVVAAATLALFLGAPAAKASIRGLFERSLGAGGGAAATAVRAGRDAYGLALAALWRDLLGGFAATAALPAAAVVAAVVAASLVQTGFRSRRRSMGFDVSRIRPRRGSLSARDPEASTAYRAIRVLARTAAVAVAIVAVVPDAALGLARMPAAGVRDPWAFAMAAVHRFLFATGIALALPALFDYLYRRKRLHDSLMTTPAARRETLRREEGDPSIRARRRREAAGIAGRAGATGRFPSVVRDGYTARDRGSGGGRG